MKLLQPNNPWRRSIISRVYRVLSFSTTTSATLASPDSSNSLYRRISPVGDPRVSIVPILDQWIEEGRDLKQIEIVRMIKQLRSYRRFNHALEMSEWMSCRRLLDLSPGDIAIRLDLVSKVHGMKEAEKYFNSIPDSSKVFQVYGALLNCYAHSKYLDKAEVLMQKMKELGFANTLAYNVMINLYSQMKKHEKLDILMQEMEDKGINCDTYTFTTRLSAYAAASDIEGMEKLLMKMEVDPIVTMDWHSYVVAANGYLKAGLIEKASVTLKKSEQLISGKSRRFAYEVILTLYSSMGNKDEVYRIWNLYKNACRANNSGYICMISSLVKLDDIDGAEKIFKDWESGNTCYDIRVPNLLVSAYCMKGLLKKAEAFINSLVDGGKELSASTWDRLAKGYYIQNQMAEAVETLKKVVLTSQSATGWKPQRSTLAACLKFLKEKGDVEVAEELIWLFMDRSLISLDTFNGLLRFIKDKDLDSIAFDQMGGGDETRDADMQ